MPTPCGRCLDLSRGMWLSYHNSLAAALQYSWARTVKKNTVYTPSRFDMYISKYVKCKQVT